MNISFRIKQLNMSSNQITIQNMWLGAWPLMQFFIRPDKPLYQDWAVVVAAVRLTSTDRQQVVERHGSYMLLPSDHEFPEISWECSLKTVLGDTKGQMRPHKSHKKEF